MLLKVSMFTVTATSYDDAFIQLVSRFAIAISYTISFRYNFWISFTTFRYSDEQSISSHRLLLPDTKIHFLLSSFFFRTFLRVFLPVSIDNNQSGGKRYPGKRISRFKPRTGGKKEGKRFLDAFSHFCMRVCPSVRPSVRQSFLHTQVELQRNGIFSLNLDKQYQEDERRFRDKHASRFQNASDV